MGAPRRLEEEEGPGQGPEERKGGPSWPLMSGSGSHRKKAEGILTVSSCCPARLSPVGKGVAGI